MSTKAYSLDLRKRVINRIKSGKSQRSVANYYEISKSAVNRWWNRYLSENTIEAKKAPGNKGKIDPKALEDFVIKNPNMIISDAAKAFQVSNAAIHKLLKKLKFSYKKKASPTWSQN